MKEEKRQNMEKRRGRRCIGFGLSVMILLAAEVVLLAVERLVYGASPATLAQSCIHHIATCIVWAVGISIVFIVIKRERLLPDSTFGFLPEKSAAGTKRWWLLWVIIAAGILFMTVNWDMRIKPVVELMSRIERFGGIWAGLTAFACQYMYYAVESGLILAFVALGQQAGESLLEGGRRSRIPWGGLFCALTWGLPHFLTKNMGTALMSVVLSLLFWAAYQAAERQLVRGYAAIALLFML